MPLLGNFHHKVGFRCVVETLLDDGMGTVKISRQPVESIPQFHTCKGTLYPMYLYILNTRAKRSKGEGDIDGACSGDRNGQDSVGP